MSLFLPETTSIRNLDLIHRCDKKKRYTKVKSARQAVGNGLDRSNLPNSDHPANATELNCYWVLAPFHSPRFRSSINGTVKTVPYGLWQFN